MMVLGVHLAGFNLTMTNVTNPTSSWCMHMVYIERVSLQDTMVSLDTVQLNRSTLASVLYIFNVSDMQNVMVTMRNVTHVGSNAMMRIGAPFGVATVTTNIHVMLMNVTVHATGTVSSGKTSCAFLQIQLSLVGAIIALHDVLIIDEGLIGTTGGVVLSSLSISSNVSVTVTNLVATFTSASFYSVYVALGAMSSSLFFLHNHVLHGESVLVPLGSYAIVVNDVSLKSNSAFSLNNATVGAALNGPLSTSILLYVALSTLAHNTAVNVTCAQGLMHAGPMLLMTSTTLDDSTAMLLQLQGNFVFPPNVNWYVVLVSNSVVGNRSSIVLRLPRNTTSLLAAGHMRHISFRFNAFDWLDADD